MNLNVDAPILPLTCFPPIVWAAIAVQSNCLIDVHEHYIKQTNRNRYEILGVNGIIMLTVPVQGQKGQKIPTKEILIAGKDWRKLHCTSIRSAYGRAAFFEHYFEDIQKIILGKQETLLELNLEILHWLIASQIPLNIKQSEMSGSQSNLDFRSTFEPAQEWPAFAPYPQVFSDRFVFQQNLSILDLLMNLGPRSATYLSKVNTTR